jgi:hypothetical protein
MWSAIAVLQGEYRSGMDLAEFLLARIDEDDALVASVQAQLDDPGAPDREAYLVAIRAGTDHGTALRAIIELHSDAHECPVYDHNGDIDNCGWIDEGYCPTVKHLAAIYARYPDYQQEWKP